MINAAYKTDTISYPFLDVLLAKNEEYKNQFHNNLIFQLMTSGQLSSPEKQEKLLGYLHIWSVSFQRMMLLKTAICDDHAFSSLFSQHLDEEYGHDKILFNERQNKDFKSDAILEALCHWFFSKMLSFTPHEQIVVVHLCLEAASTIFHECVIPIIDPNKKSNYLKLHDELDADHENIGNSLLRDLTETHYLRLLDIQERSWKMFNALMTRIAELTISND